MNKYILQSYIPDKYKSRILQGLNQVIRGNGYSSDYLTVLKDICKCNNTEFLFLRSY